MSAKQYLTFPVTKTGVYLNEPFSRLEFWLFNPRNGKKCKIGECKMNMPQRVKDEWEQTTADLLKAHLATHVVMSEKDRHKIMAAKN